jgi:predicted ATPase
MKVIGVSGAQGGGKSSLLVELEKRGWAVDKFRVSRAVQAQLGWATLDRVLESPQVMMEFQEEVFSQKYQHDYTLAQSDGGIVLTERTFADICAYTTHWTWELHYKGMWTIEAAGLFLREYTAKCAKAQRECYAGVLLLPLMSHIVWEADLNRAPRHTCELIYEGVERFTERRDFLLQKRFTINAHSVADRATQVEHFLESV